MCILIQKIHLVKLLEAPNIHLAQNLLNLNNLQQNRLYNHHHKLAILELTY